MRGDFLRCGAITVPIEELPDWIRVYRYSADSWVRIFAPKTAPPPNLSVPCETLLALDGGSSSKFTGKGPPPPGSGFFENQLFQDKETTVPTAERWWLQAARKYAEKGRQEGRWDEVSTENIVRCLRVWPARFGAAGLPIPLHARDVSPDMILQWKARPMGPGHYSRNPGPLRQTTAFQALWMLQGFLAAHGNPAARLEGLWRLKRGDATNRRWFDGATIDRMYSAARTDAERLALALTAWAGLRRREAVSLTVADVNLAVDAPSVVVTRKGGRRQELPIARSVANALRPFVVDRNPSERVYPKGYSAFARDLRELGRRAGVGAASPHDFRRSFGRILYYERRQDLNSIRVLYGHASTEQTLYYIGATMDSLRTAVETFDRSRRPLPTSPVSGGK